MSDEIVKKDAKPWLFKKGCAPGPGRPSNAQTLALLIGKESAQGAELISWAFKFLRGEVTSLKVLPNGEAIATQPTVGERLEALKILLERFAGRPREEMALTVQDAPAPLLDPLKAKVLSDDDLVNLAAILSRAIEASAGSSPGGDRAEVAGPVIEVLPTRPDGASETVSNNAKTGPGSGKS